MTANRQPSQETRPQSATIDALPNHTLQAKTFSLLPIALAIAVGSLLYTSPSLRAKQLAQVLHSKRHDLQEPVVDQRLCEMDFGCWEMHPWEKIPRTAIDAWVADFPDHRFGGKESTQEVIDRVAWALGAMKKLNVPEAVWVTHAGVIKSVQFLIANAGRRQISSAEEWPMVSLPFGAWIEVDISAYESW